MVVVNRKNKNKIKNKLKKNYLVGELDVLGSAVADKHGLSAPLNDEVLALGDVGHVDLNLGQGEHIGRGGETPRGMGEKRYIISTPRKVVAATYDKKSTMRFFAMTEPTTPVAPTIMYEKARRVSLAEGSRS